MWIKNGALQPFTRICAVVSLVLVINSLDAAIHNNNVNENIFNVAIIGSGVAGLLSAKHCLDHGYHVTVFEQTEQIGGVWFFTTETGKDKYGVNIHTAMYEELRANSPYQAMEFPDLSYPKNVTSYPSQKEILDYLHVYAKQFDLMKHIKLSHLVIRVLPIEDGKWEIIVKNLRSSIFETVIYDAVFVCNGHFSKPFYPKIRGSNKFKGNMIHSHDFRTAEAYRDDTVLVIGGGLSGEDIVDHLTKTAKRITQSRFKRPNGIRRWFPKKVTFQNEVESFSSTGAKFIDGSHETFDKVILATGYNYSYSFLSSDAEIRVENKLVLPLYKHIFNINHPTMVFIGSPNNITLTVYDLQVRYALTFISGAKKLPVKSQMLKYMQQTLCQYNDVVGCDRNSIANVTDYARILTEEAEIKGLPPVHFAIIDDSRNTHRLESLAFRNYKYIVIDDKRFRKEKCKEYF